jgi:hypothetical protein
VLFRELVVILEGVIEEDQFQLRHVVEFASLTVLYEVLLCAVDHEDV